MVMKYMYIICVTCEVIVQRIYMKMLLKSEYWKDETYHPSLFKFNKNTIKDKILLIGKVIKKKTNKKQNVVIHCMKLS